jgi:hypothetical protein
MSHRYRSHSGTRVLRLHKNPRSAAIPGSAEAPFRGTKGQGVPYGSRLGHVPVTM